MFALAFQEIQNNKSTHHLQSKLFSEAHGPKEGILSVCMNTWKEQSCLNMILVSQLQAALLQQRGWTRSPPEVPSGLSHSVIMWKAVLLSTKLTLYKKSTQIVTCKDSNAYLSVVQHTSQPVSSSGEYCARTVLWKSPVLHLLHKQRM